jgi:hypothetical protein
VRAWPNLCKVKQRRPAARRFISRGGPLIAARVAPAIHGTQTALRPRARGVSTAGATRPHRTSATPAAASASAVSSTSTTRRRLTGDTTSRSLHARQGMPMREPFLAIGSLTGHCGAVSIGGPSRIGVAVAGIVATALVGIAGTTGSWLIARDERAHQRALANDERSHQRALAHDERIYDKRAAAYVDALVLMDRQRDELVESADQIAQHAGAPSQLRNTRPLLARDRFVYARIRAYGSDHLISEYVELRVAALSLWRKALSEPKHIQAGLTSFRSIENRFAKTARAELR